MGKHCCERNNENCSKYTEGVKFEEIIKIKKYRGKNAYKNRDKIKVMVKRSTKYVYKSKERKDCGERGRYNEEMDAAF